MYAMQTFTAISARVHTHTHTLSSTAQQQICLMRQMEFRLFRSLSLTFATLSLRYFSLAYLHNVE